MSLSLQKPDWSNPSNDAYGKFDLIRQYLEDDVSNLSTTALRLTAGMNDPTVKDPAESDEAFLWSLWATVLSIVQQLPHNHSYQDKLVKLLDAIKNAPAPDRRPALEQLGLTWKPNTWQILPVFGAEVRETWNLGPWEVPLEGVFVFPSDKPFHRDVWLSLNAFICRVTVASVANFDSYATWILGHTLETERLVSELDNNIPAAASWILYAGDRIYHNAAWEDTNPPETYQSYVRYLRRFQKSFSRERWDFWKDRFAEIGTNEDVSQETRDWAQDAVERMGKIEEREPEPLIEDRPSLPPSGQMSAFTMQDMSGWKVEME